MGSREIFRPLVVGLLLMFFTCVAMSSPLRQGKQQIFVTSNGWHTGIVLKRNYLSFENMPEISDFPQAEFVEFGWGDAKFYPAKEATVGITLAAALMPTLAVMHVVGLPAEPSRYFTHAEVVPLSLGKQDLDRLIAFIADSFDRKSKPRADPIASGLYKSSYFYPAKGKFHLLNTCNSWTARALRAGGFNIKLFENIRAESLMQQVRTLSRV